MKKAVLKICFQDYLLYSEKTGFQTLSFSLPFKVFRVLNEGESLLVEIGGVAPPSNRHVCLALFQTRNIAHFEVQYR
jgi:hypothetical protein